MRLITTFFLLLFASAATLVGAAPASAQVATGDITVVKVCIGNESNLTFDISLEQDGQEVESGTVSCNTPFTFEDIEDDGDYDVVEIDDDAQTNAVGCEGIEIAVGETRTCTITNSFGTITIVKDVDPEPDGTNFSFTDNIPGCDIGTLDDDGPTGSATPNSRTCEDVPVGIYQVTEQNSAYILTDIDCTESGGDNNSTTASRTATIRLEAGETVDCVFNNVPPSTATPTPTSTATVTVTPTTTITATPTATKTPVTPTKTAVPPPTPGVIVPPSTGDGGLMGGGAPWAVGVMTLVVASGGAWLIFQRLLRRSTQR